MGNLLALPVARTKTSPKNKFSVKNQTRHVLPLITDEDPTGLICSLCELLRVLTRPPAGADPASSHLLQVRSGEVGVEDSVCSVFTPSAPQSD